MTEERAGQLTGGVFLVGIGLIFATGIGFWPHILLVIAATSAIKGLTSLQRGFSEELKGSLFLLAVWAFFGLGLSFWVIPIVMGLGMIFGKSMWDSGWGNDEAERDEEGFGTRRTDLTRKRKMDELDEDERISYVVGDDGELVPEDEYESAKRKSR